MNVLRSTPSVLATLQENTSTASPSPPILPRPLFAYKCAHPLPRDAAKWDWDIKAEEKKDPSGCGGGACAGGANYQGKRLRDQELVELRPHIERNGEGGERCKDCFGKGVRKEEAMKITVPYLFEVSMIRFLLLDVFHLSVARFTTYNKGTTISLLAFRLSDSSDIAALYPPRIQLRVGAYEYPHDFVLH